MSPSLPATSNDADLLPRPPTIPALDAIEFSDLNEMIGDEGVMEMVMIFESETRQRMLRLAANDQDIGTLVREMHTLKGAASTVAAPRLAVLGRSLEHAARRGIAPTLDDVEEIAAALDAWLEAVRDWSTNHLRGWDRLRG